MFTNIYVKSNPYSKQIFHVFQRPFNFLPLGFGSGAGSKLSLILDLDPYQMEPDFGPGSGSNGAWLRTWIRIRIIPYADPNRKPPYPPAIKCKIKNLFLPASHWFIFSPELVLCRRGVACTGGVSWTPSPPPPPPHLPPPGRSPPARPNSRELVPPTPGTGSCCQGPTRTSRGRGAAITAAAGRYGAVESRSRSGAAAAGRLLSGRSARCPAGSSHSSGRRTTAGPASQTTASGGRIVWEGLH